MSWAEGLEAFAPFFIAGFFGGPAAPGISKNIAYFVPGCMMPLPRRNCVVFRQEYFLLIRMVVTANLFSGYACISRRGHAFSLSGKGN
jgi:hypothetical protein